MSVPHILRTIGEGFQSSATVKNVYGEPVSRGDRTVIPVARIAYAFGGGGGSKGEQAGPEGGGGGGGGECQPFPPEQLRSRQRVRALSPFWIGGN